MLDLAVEVRVADDDMLAAMGVLVQRAEHDGAVQARVACSVERAGDGFAAYAEGDEVAASASLDETIELLSLYVYDHAMAAADPAGAVVAVDASHHGKRILALAERTTRGPLAIELVRRGVAVHGAGLTVLDHRRARALAAPFYFMNDNADAPPELNRTSGGLPRVARGDSVIRAFHPDSEGAEWRIEDGPVDVLVDVRLGGSSNVRVTDAPHWEMAQLIGRNALARRPPAMARELAHLVGHARCVRLELPGLDNVLSAIDHIVR